MENGMTGTEEKHINAIFCRGESMQPLFRPGDRICFVPCRVEELRQGDVIIFIPPGQKERVVHRVVSTGPEGIRTRGDANPCADAWELRQEDILGRAESRVRNGRVSAVAVGFAGRLLSACILSLRKMDHLASYVLHPCYRSLARAGLVRAFVPHALRPKVITFERDGQREMQLVLGRRIIGRRPAGVGAWAIRRPFRLFVEEDSLPGVKETEGKNSRF
jgi:signal peptidase I